MIDYGFFNDPFGISLVYITNTLFFWLSGVCTIVFSQDIIKLYFISICKLLLVDYLTL